MLRVRIEYWGKVNLRRLLEQCDDQGIKENALVPTYHCMHTPGTPDDPGEYPGHYLLYHCMHTLCTPEDQGKFSGLHLPLHAQSKCSWGPRWMLWYPPTIACTLQILQRTKMNGLVSTYHCMHTPSTLEDQGEALVSTYHCMHTPGTVLQRT